MFTFYLNYHRPMMGSHLLVVPPPFILPVSPQPFTLVYAARVRAAGIYMHRKDKGTFLWHGHNFKGVYESWRTTFRLQTWLENRCKLLKTRL